MMHWKSLIFYPRLKPCIDLQVNLVTCPAICPLACFLALYYNNCASGVIVGQKCRKGSHQEMSALPPYSPSDLVQTAQVLPHDVVQRRVMVRKDSNFSQKLL